MLLSTFKLLLQSVSSLRFELPDGSFVPAHFHITEVGKVQKHYIDCGGTVRTESKVNFQLWEANDFDHSLAPSKLLNIIHLSEEKIGISDDEIEVEYQMQTIGKFGIEFNGDHFVLTATQTDCLAKDKCGIPETKLKMSLSSLTTKSDSSSCCTPGSGCC
ncbi:MAG: hypothetical protein GC193_14080 [Cryomorphaceae bacterium]|nr:hypothetical protein [Cryomorphaceae bacterium]